MSSANVNLVRSIFAAWARGDFSSTDWAQPEIEYVRADGPAPGSWTGLAGMADGFRDFVNAWEGWRVEADDYRELDGERILVLVHYGGRGRTSGLELGQIGTNAAVLFYVHGGKVARLVIYADRARALADLGLG
jgi:ketosteroid isomerase-like protein